MQTILVVDDEFGVAEVLAVELEDEGYRVVMAANGRHGLERLAENRFILTPGGKQIYIGTPHSYYSLYADTPRREIGEEDVFLKHYKRLSIPLLNKKRGERVA